MIKKQSYRLKLDSIFTIMQSLSSSSSSSASTTAIIGIVILFIILISLGGLMLFFATCPQCNSCNSKSRFSFGDGGDGETTRKELAMQKIETNKTQIRDAAMKNIPQINQNRNETKSRAVDKACQGKEIREPAVLWYFLTAITNTNPLGTSPPTLRKQSTVCPSMSIDTVNSKVYFPLSSKQKKYLFLFFIKGEAGSRSNIVPPTITPSTGSRQVTSVWGYPTSTSNPSASNQVITPTNEASTYFVYKSIYEVDAGATAYLQIGQNGTLPVSATDDIKGDIKFIEVPNSLEYVAQ